MDGEAHDFMIDEQGNLVAVEEHEWEVVGLRALAVITQEVSGELSLQVFGQPSQELSTALQAAMKSLVTPQ